MSSWSSVKVGTRFLRLRTDVVYFFYLLYCYSFFLFLASVYFVVLLYFFLSSNAHVRVPFGQLLRLQIVLAYL